MKNSFDNMMSLDIYASNLDKEEYAKISDKLIPSSKKSINILSWGIQDLFEEKSVLCLTTYVLLKHFLKTITGKTTYQQLLKITTTNR